MTREDNKTPRRTREKTSGNGRVALVCTERINVFAADVSLDVVVCPSQMTIRNELNASSIPII